jgi:hypothetical protein
LLLALALLTVACKRERAADEDADARPKDAEPESEAPEPEPEPEPPAPSEAGAAIADAVDPARFEAELRFVAAERSPGSDHWQAVQDRCFEVFEAAGLAPVRFEVEGSGVSVIGHTPGADPDLPEVVIGGHYDHIEDCAGADDNASGTAAVLEIARVLGAHEWQRGLTIACWDEEESGLFGSGAWADAAVADGRKFAVYLNFDAIAYADDTPGSQTLPPGVDLLFAKEVALLEARESRADFIALLADDAAHDVSLRLLGHAKRVELPAALLEIPARLKNEAALSDLRRSDHASFWRHDIPAVFLSDTANFRTDTYHCTGRPDTVDTLDLGFAVKVVRIAAGVSAELLNSGADPGSR